VLRQSIKWWTLIGFMGKKRNLELKNKLSKLRAWLRGLEDKILIKLITWTVWDNWCRNIVVLSKKWSLKQFKVLAIVLKRPLTKYMLKLTILLPKINNSICKTFKNRNLILKSQTWQKLQDFQDSNAASSKRSED
jgi:hypothetical protein